MTGDALGEFMKRKKVGEILMDRGLITGDQLEEALQKQKASTPRQLLGEIIVEMGLCTSDQIIEALADAHGVPYAQLEPALVDPGVSRLLARKFIEEHKILPMFFVDNVLTVAVSEPANLYLVEEVRNMIEGNVQVVAAAPADIEMMLETHVPDENAYNIEDLVEESSAGIDLVEREMPEVVNLEEVASESPVIKIVNYMIHSAVKERASDIHIEPDDYALRVRFRIDGQLVERLNPPYQMHPAIVSRIKIMSSLDISERRLPQDGSIHVLLQGKPVDLRVSILPTTFGEKVVVRIIDKSTILMDMKRLGMGDQVRALFEREISRPNGMFLVTGPTGSGKSTTLYSVLAQLDRPEINICTAEDPIEFNLKNVNQFQVHEKIGMSFASILRSLLRQDPDVIMVGEMRDTQTAMIGVQAALTGHMVFSTLHTNDAPGAITRLYNLGIEPYLVGAALTGVLAQRLVRQICQRCRTETELPESLSQRLEQLKVTSIKTFYKGKGCPRCNNTGHLGRVGIFELLVPDDRMRDMITGGATLDQLRAHALSTGMTALFRDGIEKVSRGATTIDEVLRVTVEG